MVKIIVSCSPMHFTFMLLSFLFLMLWQLHQCARQFANTVQRNWKGHFEFNCLVEGETFELYFNIHRFRFFLWSRRNVCPNIFCGIIISGTFCVVSQHLSNFTAEVCFSYEVCDVNRTSRLFLIFAHVCMYVCMSYSRICDCIVCIWSLSGYNNDSYLMWPSC